MAPANFGHDTDRDTSGAPASKTPRPNNLVVRLIIEYHGVHSQSSARAGETLPRQRALLLLELWQQGRQHGGELLGQFGHFLQETDGLLQVFQEFVADGLGSNP